MPSETAAKRPVVTVFTDGGCQGNPGPGGYGAILIYKDRRKEISGGYRRTTNNRMEIMAVIAALRALKPPCIVKVYSDSQYVVNAISKGWAAGWRAKGWMKARASPAKNPDLWEELLGLCAQHEVTFSWLRGHAGHAENERCDELSVAAAKGPNLAVDAGYEAAKASQVSM